MNRTANIGLHFEDKHCRRVGIFKCYERECEFATYTTYRIYGHLRTQHGWTPEMVVAAKANLPQLRIKDVENRHYVDPKQFR